MDQFEKAFHETLLALGQENLNNLIIVGGWCPYLYAQYVWKRAIPFPKTHDIDFAVKNMTPDRFSEPVYAKLIKANLVPKKIDIDDDNRTQFNYVEGKFSVPIEFVTSPNVLPKGQIPRMVPYVACDSVDEVAFALKMPPLRQEIEYKGNVLNVQIASSSAFIVVKGLLIQHRTDAKKIDKDLASIAFVLRYSPDPDEIIGELQPFEKDSSFKEFLKIMKGLLKKPTSRGFKMLESTYLSWGIPKNKILTEVGATFEPLLKRFQKPNRT